MWSSLSFEMADSRAKTIIYMWAREHRLAVEDAKVLDTLGQVLTSDVLQVVL